MRRVIIESPFAAPTVELFFRNKRYLTAAILDCIVRGEAPFASHRLYTDSLDDTIPAQRDLGIQAGFAWRSAAEATVAYTDLGISKGMSFGIEDAMKLQHPVEMRTLGQNWQSLARVPTNKELDAWDHELKMLSDLRRRVDWENTR